MSSRVSASKRLPRKSGREVARLEPEILKLLGPPPLYEGESAEDYQFLHERLRASVAPRDAVEEIIVRDVADLSWESHRLRRLKAKLMVSARSESLIHLLDRLVTAAYATPEGDKSGSDIDGDDAEASQSEDYDGSSLPDDDEEELSPVEERCLALHSGWLRGDPAATKEIDRLLARAGYDWQVVEAEALSMRFDDFERFDRLIAQADARRDSVLRQLERHRAVFAQRLREAAAEAEDAEFEDVSDGEAAA